ncbi:MAG: hypothetical protein RR091_11090 [Cloacibacillus sp.]
MQQSTTSPTRKKPQNRRTRNTYQQRNWIQKKTATTKAAKRSGLEDQIALQCKTADIPAEYEPGRIAYTKGTAHYTPDFILPNGIVIETKGLFLPADRTKHLLIQKQHPDLDIRFVFSNPNARLSKTSKTTYAMWCDKNNLLYAKKAIPAAWIKEPAGASAAYIKSALIRKKTKCAKSTK